MRTTLSIDDQVLAAARLRAAKNNETLGEAVTEILWIGLTRRSGFGTALNNQVRGTCK